MDASPEDEPKEQISQRYTASPEEMANTVKAAARLYGARLVGIAPMNEAYVNLQVPHRDRPHKEQQPKDVQQKDRIRPFILMKEKIGRVEILWLIIMQIEIRKASRERAAEDQSASAR